jgi:hypothetical protein
MNLLVSRPKIYLFHHTHTRTEHETGHVARILPSLRAVPCQMPCHHRPRAVVLVLPWSAFHFSASDIDSSDVEAADMLGIGRLQTRVLRCDSDSHSSLPPRLK